MAESDKYHKMDWAEDGYCHRCKRNPCFVAELDAINAVLEAIVGEASAFTEYNRFTNDAFRRIVKLARGIYSEGRVYDAMMRQNLPNSCAYIFPEGDGDVCSEERGHDDNVHGSAAEITCGNCGGEREAPKTLYVKGYDICRAPFHNDWQKRGDCRGDD